MRLKTWLLTGTSIGFMALAPLSAMAQDAELQAAYQQYLQAQASGDAAALEAAQGSLTELCIVGGYGSVDECIAALNATGSAAPAAEPEPQPEPEPVPEEPAPEVIEEPAPEVVEEPAPEPVVEEPAPEPVAEEPAPEPVVEEPAPEAPVEAPLVEEPAPEPAAEAPAVQEEPAPEQPAAVEEQPAPEQPVEAAPEQPAPEAPAAEQPAPEETVTTQEAPEAPVVDEAPVEQPAPTDAPVADIGAQLTAQVEAYEQGVADLLSGGDAADAQARLGAARAEIEALCAQSGQPDVDACLAQYGLTLPVVPGIEVPAAPVTETTPEAPIGETSPEAPVTDAPVAEQPAPVEEVTPDGQVAEPIVELPEGVTAEQIAPVLDSAKDQEAVPEGQPVEGEATTTVEGQPPVDDAAVSAQMVVPESDEASQSDAIRAFAAEPIAVVTEEQGTEIVAADNTTVTQTIVNNYVTNITNNVTNTNVTNNNVTNNTQNNIGQQNNVTFVEAPTYETNTGDIITQVILQVGSQLVVNSIGQDTDRFYNPQEDEIYYEELSNGRVREVITRPDGSQIVTVRNRNGDVLRRSRIAPDGQEYVLAYFDERNYDDLNEWRDPGADLPPLRLNIPVRDYVLDARYADEQELERFFVQPPVEQVARLYSIDEVKRSARVRDSVRKLEVGNLTFDTGAATIGRDQVQGLSAVANAMLAVLQRNPNETFLIEGHTDAIGSDISNLRLSDLRAATVARVLTDFYGVPPENLATQGYGERYLKIRTEAAERENRRVTIRRITPLITVAQNG